MADAKTEAKAEKKKAKAKAKAAKKNSKIRKKPKETIIIKEEAKKDWRSNIWLYIAVAIIIGLTVWFITSQLSKFYP